MKMFKTEIGSIMAIPVSLAKVIESTEFVQYHNTRKEADEFLLQRELDNLIYAKRLELTSSNNLGIISARIENYESV